MTKSGLPALLASLILLPSGSLAATLHDSSALVRRESTGAIRDLSKQAKRLGCTDCAKKDYIVGNTRNGAHAGVASCKQSNHTLVVDYDACHDAAQRAGAHTEPEHRFKITEEQFVKKYPRGCFHVKCPVPYDAAADQQTTKDCYFLNEGDSSVACTDSDCRGTPICERDLFEDGAKDGVGSCPPDYVVIHNETLCNEMCGILNDKCNEFFRIGNDNFTEHFDYPEGCFHLRDSGGSHNATSGTTTMDRIFFNPPMNQPGTNVRGTVMCDVEVPFNWSSAAAQALDSGDLVSGHHDASGGAYTTAAPA